MKNPDCVFRGSRNYLHSTTLLNHIFEHLDQRPRDIDFTFHRETANQCCIEDAPPDNDSLLIATYKDSERALYVTDNGEPINKRVPYDEVEATSVTGIDGTAMNFPGLKTGYSFVESLIAGYKQLLEHLFPEQTRKYAFARMQLDREPEDDFVVRHARIIAGKFYQGDITARDETIGHIYFGIW